MKKPPIPKDELLRLETLRSLSILDTDPEERFDRVTRLAKHLFDAPIALVSLVDDQRQWFKSRQGLSATETPREISFCGHAICEQEIMVVEDALEDERFDDNPLVCGDPNIRFYAGFPLSAPNGVKIGTLCVIDKEPREPCENDLDMLRLLGEIVEEELAVTEIVNNDPLTGLANGGGFTVIANHLIATSFRTGSPMALGIARSTNHYLIEATFGSDQCDRSAIELSQMLIASLRDSDLVARLEPDLYAVLMTTTKFGDAASVEKRLINNIDQRNAFNQSEYDLVVDFASLEVNEAIHPNAAVLIEAGLQKVNGQDSNDPVTGALVAKAANN